MKPYQNFARAFSYSILRRERQSTADAHQAALGATPGEAVIEMDCMLINQKQA
jgi:hypothetical protein